MKLNHLILTSALATCALLSAGCADVAYRGTLPAAEVVERACNPAVDTGHDAFEVCRFDKVVNGGKQLYSGHYALGFVEFDDQGWLHESAAPGSNGQIESLMDQLQHLRRRARERVETRDAALGSADECQGKDQHFLIMVYVHGWKHSAAQGDSDLRSFRGLLEDLDRYEHQDAASGDKAGTRHCARMVVGVYVGWRGATVPIWGLENLTFWTRKNSAARVGDGSVRQLLVQLNELRADLNGWSGSTKLAGWNQSQLVTIAHSFGGLVVFRALQGPLIDRGLRRDGEKHQYRMAKSFGDFVLLVNPAFEGAIYEPLWNAALARQGFPEGQRPILATVTSKTDWATGWAFPIGRLYTYGQSAPHSEREERATVLRAVGHLNRYVTHELHRVRDLSARTVTDEVSGNVSSSLPKLDLATVAAERAALTAPGGDATFQGSCLERVGNKKLPSGFPYLNIRADKEMIDGHNEIWNPNFQQFVLDFVALNVSGEAVSDPAQQAAWRRAARRGINECREE